MEFRFKADEWKNLTAAQRAHRCRLMAEEAMDLAKSADPPMAKAYRGIAADWLKLALEIESRPSAYPAHSD